MMQLAFPLLSVACSTLLILVSCSRADNTSASSSSASTLIGAWKAPGKVPVVNRDLNQRWITMQFASNGKVHINYQEGMPVFSDSMSPGYIMALMKPKHEDLPYDDLGKGKLRVTYGDQAVTYTYEISHDKLYITPPAELGSAAASVYDRADH